MKKVLHKTFNSLANSFFWKNLVQNLVVSFSSDESDISDSPGFTESVDFLAKEVFIYTFSRYIFRQLEFAVELSPQTIFEQDNETKLFKLKENITFHLFTTDTPCK